MTDTHYDAIVVGARVAGSPTAMLLARKGYRVLLVDRANFPSDTVSSHLLQPRGVAYLKQWGLLDRLRDTGCPPIHTYSITYGTTEISGKPGTPGSPVSYSPKRIVLDQLLLTAAQEAGAEVRMGFAVEDLVIENGRVAGVRGHLANGSQQTIRANVVIGADGVNSVVAKEAGATEYDRKPKLAVFYYSYWSGVPMDNVFDCRLLDGRMLMAAPTHDGHTMIGCGWPYAELVAHRNNVEVAAHKSYELSPGFADRLRDGVRETGYVGMPLPNYFRTPYGPGWALVGDAGHVKDPITGYGISDAFRDANLCTSALDVALSGTDTFDNAMARYRHARDQHAKPLYEHTTDLAALTMSTQLSRVVQAVAGNQRAMDGFMRATAGTNSPATFFSLANLAPLFAGAKR